MYFSVELGGNGIERLLSLIQCVEHGQFLVGSTVKRGRYVQTITRVGVSSRVVNTIALDNGAYNPDHILDGVLTLAQSVVKALSECSPAIKLFFDSLLEDKREAARCEVEKARKEKEHHALRSQVLNYAGGGNLVLARKIYDEQCSAWWPLADYEQALIAEAKVRRFAALLGTGPLHAVDIFFKEHLRDQLSVDELATLKIPLLRRYLKKCGVVLDAEQERTLASPFPRVQIRARAGSGKTRTLAARAALSIADEKLKPDQVLILAFNKPAAAEIKARVQKLLNGSDYANSRTFHSLAFQLVKPDKKILFDEGGSVSEREQSQFAQRMLQRILNPAFQEEMVKFFRQELEQIESIGRDLLPDEYYIFRRSLEHVTLGGQWVRANGEKIVTNGERVKSKGEKFIADFLFEHDIPYRYERAWMWKTPFLDGAIYKPDFSIVANGRDYILEHWAFNPNDANAMLPSYWSQTATQYRQQIQEKRQFWASKNIALLETHSGMLANGREAFEKELKGILEQEGICCSCLPEAEVVKRVFQNDFLISRMAGLFMQFIQRAKKRTWSPDKVAEILNASKEREPRIVSFYRLALRAYREYELMKQEESAIDYDDLMLDATRTVERQGAEATIHLGAGRTIALGDIKWILLDEYQDFSQLYFRMLNAVLKVCPNIRVVAVGDDWQAINSFAGAELTFFEEFSQYFPGGETVGITTNYRSGHNIVAGGNRLMAGRGPSAVAHPLRQPGVIDFVELSRCFVQFVRTPATEAEWQQDQAYLPKGTNGRPSERGLRQAQALKSCVQVLRPAFEKVAIAATTKSADGYPYALLVSRTGYAYGFDLPELKSRLVDILIELTGADRKLLNRFIQTMTAHGSKGREAHTVIILEATERQFPKIHPDNLLFEIFGTTQRKVLDEERRLFYVAVSRAMERLVVLTEKDKESPYLNALQARNVTNATDNTPAFAATPRLTGPLAERIRELLPVESPLGGAVVTNGSSPDALEDLLPVESPLGSASNTNIFELGCEPPF